LTQLQQAIENDTNLPDTDKADLLEQVQALAEAQQAKEPTKKEGLIRKANKIFDATLKSLPNTAAIVESCSKLLPMILKVLGISA
ncbi:MAG: low-complexity protein, partial [Cyanobacteriota bacterium]